MIMMTITEDEIGMMMTMDEAGLMIVDLMVAKTTARMATIQMEDNGRFPVGMKTRDHQPMIGVKFSDRRTLIKDLQ